MPSSISRIRTAGARARVRDEDRAARSTLPAPLKIAMIALLVPITFQLGSLALTPSKIVFLILVPILTINLLRGAYGRIVFADVVLYLFVFWLAVAMLVNHSPGVAIEYVGSNGIIILGGYLSARAYIRDLGTFHAFIRFLGLIIVVSVPFAIHEARTGQALIPRFIEDFTGLESHTDVMNRFDDIRFGLFRAQFAFQHPIHFGLFCSTVFSLYFVGMKDQVSDFGRWLMSFLIILCCFLSVSSGPFLSILVQIALIGWFWALRAIPQRWSILTALLAVFYTIIEIGSNRFGLYALVERMSFSPETAFVRKLLFTFGTQQISRTPLFGVGYNPWGLPTWMTGSLDNFWLMLAIVFGLPALLLLSLFFLVTIFQIARKDLAETSPDNAARRAWLFTIVGLILNLATVAVWGEMYSFVLMIFGSAIWMISPSEATQATPTRAGWSRNRATKPTPPTENSAATLRGGHYKRSTGGRLPLRP